MDNDDMSKECKDEVTRDMNRMATDYRLNYRLNHACEADTAKLCPNLCAAGQSCGGLVLQCLQVRCSGWVLLPVRVPVWPLCIRCLLSGQSAGPA